MFDASLPSLPTAFSRRRAILGVAALTVSPVVASPTPAVPAALDPADARLVELADAYYALDTAVNASTLDLENPVYEAMIRNYTAIEEEMAETAAVTMTGVLAKARLCQLRVFRDCVAADMTLSIADDLVRLHAEGGARV